MKKLVILFLSIITMANSTFAQGQMAAPTPSMPGKEDLARKKVKLWHHPKKKNPTDQLIYARQLEKNGHYKKACKQYDALVRKWHESQEAVRAQYEYAKLLEKRKKYQKAFDEYQYLATFYAGRYNYEDFLNKELTLANKVRDQRHLKYLTGKGIKTPSDAIPMYKKIIKNAPEWKHADEVLFNIGDIQEKDGKYDEAKDSFEKLLLEYPESELIDNAAYRCAYCAYKYSNKKPRDRVICRDALTAQADYLNNYGDSKENVVKVQQYMKELKDRLVKMYFDTAEFYDKTGHFKSALIEYNHLVKKFPDSSYTGKAIERIDFINKKIGQNENE